MSNTVKSFDPKTQIKLQQNIGIFGPRGSGKTHVAAQICKHLEAQYHNIRFIIVGDYVDDELYPESAVILKEWNEDEIEELLEAHKKMWEYIDGVELYFVFDDIPPVHYRKSKMLNKIVDDGWSDHCTTVRVCQEIQQMPYAMGSNLDWIICGHYPTYNDKQAIFHEFFYNKLSRHDFEKLYKQVVIEPWSNEESFAWQPEKHKFLATNLTDEMPPAYHFYKCPFIKKQKPKKEIKIKSKKGTNKESKK